MQHDELPVRCVRLGGFYAHNRCKQALEKRASVASV